MALRRAPRLPTRVERAAVPGVGDRGVARGTEGSARGGRSEPVSREGSEVAGSLRCSSALPSAVEGRGGAARRFPRDRAGARCHEAARPPALLGQRGGLVGIRSRSAAAPTTGRRSTAGRAATTQQPTCRTRLILRERANAPLRPPQTPRGPRPGQYPSRGRALVAFSAPTTDASAQRAIASATSPEPNASPIFSRVRSALSRRSISCV